MKNNNLEQGITLVVLVISIIIMLILTVVCIQKFGKINIIEHSITAQEQYSEASIKENIVLAYNLWKIEKEEYENLVLEDVLERELEPIYKNNVKIRTIGKTVIIVVVNGDKEYKYTLLDSGKLENDETVYLNIADGTIQLKENGFIQGENSLISHQGKYNITGTSKENVVRITDKGVYDITIENLNIDVSDTQLSAFNANAGKRAKDCFVSITLEGENYLQGGYGPGLGFSGATPNLNGETNGSTLTICGDGSLEARGLGNGYAASGIGSSYNGDATGNVNNIIINSGNITAIGKGNAAGIGATHGRDANNIIINGGNIYAKGGSGAGIGTYSSGTSDNIVISGGNIVTYGGDPVGGIGSSKVGSGKVIINGGVIDLITNVNYDWCKSALGGQCKEIIIAGGTINITTKRFSAIACNIDGDVKITGGNIFAKGIKYNIAKYKDSTSDELVEYTPNNNNNTEVYLTTLKLKDLQEKKKITNIITSDNINYGTKDMYTLEDGMLYIYMPLGKREIIIETEDNTYVGDVETKESSEVIMLDLRKK